MSLTVLDVTVVSSVIIVLSLFTLLMVAKSRNYVATKPRIFQVERQAPNLSMPSTESLTLRSIGMIGITSVLFGIVLAVFTSVIVAVLFSKILGAIGQ